MYIYVYSTVLPVQLIRGFLSNTMPLFKWYLKSIQAQISVNSFHFIKNNEAESCYLNEDIGTMLELGIFFLYVLTYVPLTLCTNLSPELYIQQCLLPSSLAAGKQNMAKKLISPAHCSCVARHFLTDSVDLIVNFLVIKLVR